MLSYHSKETVMDSLVGNNLENDWLIHLSTVSVHKNNSPTFSSEMILALTSTLN